MRDPETPPTSFAFGAISGRPLPWSRRQGGDIGPGCRRWWREAPVGLGIIMAPDNEGRGHWTFLGIYNDL